MDFDIRRCVETRPITGLQPKNAFLPRLMSLASIDSVDNRVGPGSASPSGDCQRLDLNSLKQSLLAEFHCVLAYKMITASPCRPDLNVPAFSRVLTLGYTSVPRICGRQIRISAAIQLLTVSRSSEISRLAMAASPCTQRLTLRRSHNYREHQFPRRLISSILRY
jgi:hypothetical protein